MRNLEDLRLEINDGTLIVPDLSRNPIIRITRYGTVYSWDNYAIKLHKRDPKVKYFRMGEAKARSFIETQFEDGFYNKPEGILIPEGIVLNNEGEYVGVARTISEIVPSPQELSLPVIASSIKTLIKDMLSLTNKNIKMDGLTYDSYLFTPDGVKMADIDCFSNKGGNIDNNFRALMSYVGKMFYYVYFECMKGTEVDRERFKRWITGESKRDDYLKKLLEDMDEHSELTLGEYTTTLEEKALRKK